MANTLSTFIWIDLVDLFARRNGFIRTFRFAYIAVDAFVGNNQCHVGYLTGSQGFTVPDYWSPR
jgi:hypothetical protein